MRPAAVASTPCQVRITGCHPWPIAESWQSFEAGGSRDGTFGGHGATTEGRSDEPGSEGNCRHGSQQRTGPTGSVAVRNGLAARRAGRKPDWLFACNCLRLVTVVGSSSSRRPARVTPRYGMSPPPRPHGPALRPLPPAETYRPQPSGPERGPKIAEPTRTIVAPRDARPRSPPVNPSTARQPSWPAISRIGSEHRPGRPSAAGTAYPSIPTRPAIGHIHEPRPAFGRAATFLGLVRRGSPHQHPSASLA